MSGAFQLHTAAATGNIEALVLLLSPPKREHGSDSEDDDDEDYGLPNWKAKINQRNSMGETALHTAILFGQVEAAHILLSHGAKPFIGVKGKKEKKK